MEQVKKKQVNTRQEKLLVTCNTETEELFCFIPYTGEYISWLVNGEDPPEAFIKEIMSNFPVGEEDKLEIEEALSEEVQSSYQESPVDFMELLRSAGFDIYNDHMSLLNNAVENNINVRLEIVLEE